MANGLVASDAARQMVYFVGDTLDSFSVYAPNSLFSFNLSTGEFELVGNMSRPSGGSWCALISASYDNKLTNPFLVVQQVPTGKNYGFFYQVSVMDSQGEVSAPLASTPPNSTYVNFFWADFDENANIVYILAGDENSVTDLNVVLYSLNIQTGKTTSVNVDHTKFTVNYLVVDRAVGYLWSISPGLFNEEDGYVMVSINPVDGTIQPQTPFFGQQFAHEWEGLVYGPMASGAMLHRFKSKLDGSNYYAAVADDPNPIVFLSGLDTGTNHNIRLHSVIYVPPVP